MSQAFIKSKGEISSMLKRIADMCLVFTLLISLITAAPVHAAATSLSAPAGITAGVEGTQFVIKWQNPADVIQLAQSAYNSYNGALLFIVDWRVNKGSWHYDRAIRGEQFFYDVYPTIQKGFFGQLCDGFGDIKVPQTVIDKVMVGVPYNTPIEEWLKKNNVEFRVRYLYNYYDTNLWQEVNVYSAYSNSVMLGTSNPTGSWESGPTFDEYGMPNPPSAIEAPMDLLSEYMTLNLRLKVPEDVKALQAMDLWPVITSIDWKMNNGEWYVASKGLTEEIRIEYILHMDDLIIDNDGYTNITLSRDSLKIPFGKSLSQWLNDNTYYFRVRFVLMSIEENEVKYVFSPYSNTVTLGRGAVSPKQPTQK